MNTTADPEFPHATPPAFAAGDLATIYSNWQLRHVRLIEPAPPDWDKIDRWIVAFVNEPRKGGRLRIEVGNLNPDPRLPMSFCCRQDGDMSARQDDFGTDRYHVRFDGAKGQWMAESLFDTAEPAAYADTPVEALQALLDAMNKSLDTASK